MFGKNLQCPGMFYECSELEESRVNVQFATRLSSGSCNIASSLKYFTLRKKAHSSFLCLFILEITISSIWASSTVFVGYQTTPGTEFVFSYILGAKIGIFPSRSDFTEGVRQRYSPDAVRAATAFWHEKSPCFLIENRRLLFIIHDNQTNY